MIRDGRRVRPRVRSGGRAPEPAARPASPEEEFASARAQPFVEAVELERAARQVVGVQRCRVLRRGGEPLPYRVRVVVEGTRRLAVAKDIQSAWFALWGLYVPRSAFVVTPIRHPADLGADGGRLRFAGCSLTRGGGAVEAGVTLSAGGRSFEGHAAQPDRDADAVPLAARAALAAVRAAIPAGGPGDLVELRRLRVAGSPVILCALDDGRGRLLFGVSLVRGDDREAAVRAVLDAVNRVVRERW